MNCLFCDTRYTRRHWCPRLHCYKVYKKLFLECLYRYHPKSPEELFEHVIAEMKQDSRFEILDDNVSCKFYFNHFCDEYDVC